jgi:hypothetical protein
VRISYYIAFPILTVVINIAAVLYVSSQTLLSPHPHISINYGCNNTGTANTAPNITAPPFVD